MASTSPSQLVDRVNEAAPSAQAADRTVGFFYELSIPIGQIPANG